MDLCSGILVFGVVAFIAAVIIGVTMENRKLAAMSPEERKNYRLELRAREKNMKWGTISPAYICPHCQTKGSVRTKPVSRKKGISGAKATGALMTGGISMVVTGLSRKEGLTQAHCGNCNSTWDF